MSSLASTRSANIRRSVNDLVSARFEQATPAADLVTAGVTTYAAHVFYQDGLGDPRGRDQRKTPQVYWVVCRFRAAGGRAKRPSVLEVGAYFEVGHEGNQSTRDRYLLKADMILDDFEEKVWVPNDLGIKVYDYTLPAAPVVTNGWLLCLSDDGNFGAPNAPGHDLIDDGSGIVRAVATYSLSHNGSLSGQSQYW